MQSQSQSADRAKRPRITGIVLLFLAIVGISIWLAGPNRATYSTESAADELFSTEPVTETPQPDFSEEVIPEDVVRGQSSEEETPAESFDGQRSYGYLKAICDLGNRMSGSPGMKRQQALLEKHFQDLGAEVTFQRFRFKHPLNGKRVPMANMIVQWNPEAKQRILLCAHYDTRPLPDREANPRLRTQGVFLGANDGASGVALLMELGNHVANLPMKYGLDFVLFDGEELVYYDARIDDDIGKYFAGSTWFARKYVEHPPKYEYIAGVLFDMVADADLTIYQEENSATWKETRPIVNEIWGTAQRMGIKEFIPRVKYLVNDDHLPLYYIAKIPVIDVIDFRYPDDRNRYWHTTADAPGRCSGESLGKVGAVTMEWLSTKR